MSVGIADIHILINDITRRLIMQISMYSVHCVNKWTCIGALHHGALKCVISTLFTTFFLLTSLKCILTWLIYSELPPLYWRHIRMQFKTF